MSSSPLLNACIWAYTVLQVTGLTEKKSTLPAFIIHLEFLHSILYCWEIRWVTGILCFQYFFCFCYPGLKDLQVLGKGLIVQHSSLEQKRTHSLRTAATQHLYWCYTHEYSHYRFANSYTGQKQLLQTISNIYWTGFDTNGRCQSGHWH